MSEKLGEFSGFSPPSLDFLRDIKANNNKEWFDAHKQDYEEYLLNPFKQLVADLSECMLYIDASFKVTPAINKTISRIYRDTRFSKDKSPFRNTMWLTFKRSNKDWQDAPGYFFELSTDSYRYGMGFYSASKTTMDRLRWTIDNKPDKFERLLSIFSKQKIFEVEGEKYKRILDESKPEEIQNWFQRRNLYLVCNRDNVQTLLSRDLVDDLISGFDLLAPFYRFLLKIKFDSVS